MFEAEIEIEAAPSAQKILRNYTPLKLQNGRDFWDGLMALSKAGIDIYGKSLGEGEPNGAGIGMTADDSPSVIDFWKGTYQGFMFYVETGRRNKVASPHFGIYTHGGGL